MVELLTLSLICAIGASLILPVLANKVNFFVKAFSLMDFEMVTFDVRAILGVAGCALFLTFIVTLVSIGKVIKQKPIETILDK